MKSPAAGSSDSSTRYGVWRRGGLAVFRHPWRSQYFAKQHPNVRGELLYFPTRMNPALNNMANDTPREGKLTIWWVTLAIAAMSILLR